MTSPFRRRTALIVFAASLLLGSLVLATPAAASPADDIAAVTKAITLKGLLKHADRFQAIADANGDNRASGLPGYDASAAYVANKLRGAGYNVTVQPFDFPYFEEFGSAFEQVAPTPTTYVDGEDYDLMDYSGAGDVTAAVVNVDLNLTPPRASTSGCEAADFSAEVAGKIALLQRGTCPFGTKVANAEAAGAVGAVVMNQGNGDPVANADRYELFAGTLGGPVGIPAVSVSYFLGEELATTAGLVLRIQADTISTIRSTSNVLAQSRSGRTDNVVMAGAHLDSEPDTAGINMIASPNYSFGVYDGDDSAQEGSGPGPAGSAAIEQVFLKLFADRGEATKASDFTGRSDYGPFIAVGIPAGGLFTGAETIKTAADVALWGGLAGEQMDVCYHDPCDSLTPEQDNAPPGVHDALAATGYQLYGNLNTYAFDVNADAIATAVLTLAHDTSTVNGATAGAPPSRSRPRPPGRATSTSTGTPEGSGRSGGQHHAEGRSDDRRPSVHAEARSALRDDQLAQAAAPPLSHGNGRDRSARVFGRDSSSQCGSPLS